MPTYEYECTQCGRIFEVFQSIKSKPLKTVKTDCRKCNHKAPVRRLLGTGAGVIFKGSGFYQTDYRSESYKKAAKADKEAASGTTDKKDKKKSSEPGNAKKDAGSKASGDRTSSKSSGNNSD